MANTEQIKTLEELATARYNKKSVISPNTYSSFRKPLPAAFVMNMSGTTLLYLIRNGMFIYKKEK